MSGRIISQQRSYSFGLRIDRSIVVTLPGPFAPLRLVIRDGKLARSNRFPGEVRSTSIWGSGANDLSILTGAGA